MRQPIGSMRARRSGFNPILDPDLLGLWVANDASDNGTILTVPNRVSGGTAATASGVGRPTISNSAIEGLFPGIVTNTLTVPLLSSGASLNGLSACTVFFVGSDPTTTLSVPWRYGNGNQNCATFYNNAVRRFDSTKADDLGTNTLIAPGINGCMQATTRVMCWRMDIDASPREILPIWQDGEALATSSYTGPADTTGTFSTGPWSIGSNTPGSSPFQGAVSAFAVLKRALTDAEIPIWTKYFQNIIGTANNKRFLYTGDSITVGGGVGGFRKRIQDIWLARAEPDRWYRNIGNQASGTFLQDYHYGVSGRTIQQLITDLPNVIGPLNLYRPDIIPLLIGTNDISAASPTMIADYNTLLDSISALEPTALIVAQGLTMRSDGYAGATTTWNAGLPAIVASAQGRGINVIYDGTLAGVAITTPDGIHPDNAGYTLLGNALEPRTRVWAGKPA